MAPHCLLDKLQISTVPLWTLELRLFSGFLVFFFSRLCLSCQPYPSIHGQLADHSGLSEHMLSYTSTLCCLFLEHKNISTFCLNLQNSSRALHYTVFHTWPDSWFISLLPTLLWFQCVPQGHMLKTFLVPQYLKAPLRGDQVMEAECIRLVMEGLGYIKVCSGTSWPLSPMWHIMTHQESPCQMYTRPWTSKPL